MFEFRASTNVRLACGILVLGGLMSANQAAASCGSEAAGDRRALASASDARGLVARLDELGEVDPIRFFKRLVDRYRAIEDYVEESATMLILLGSRSYFESPNCRRELKAAL
ncbi:MAG: hypothetical protein CMJ27_04450, partial [Phycisphaerae bacterium]